MLLCQSESSRCQTPSRGLLQNNTSLGHSFQNSVCFLPIRKEAGRQSCSEPAGRQLGHACLLLRPKELDPEFWKSSWISLGTFAFGHNRAQLVFLRTSRSKVVPLDGEAHDGRRLGYEKGINSLTHPIVSVSKWQLQDLAWVSHGRLGHAVTEASF